MANHYQHILVAVDGSQEAEYAFRKSIDVAKRNEGSTLNIINIIDTRSLATIGTYGSEIIEQMQQTSEELLKDYQSQAEAEGITNINIILDYGSPKQLIANDLSKKVEADLIICGATGHNKVERFLIGSVSETIVRSATCDVLIVRTPE